MGACPPGCLFVLQDIRTQRPRRLFSMYGACPPDCIFVLQDIRTHRPWSFVFYVWGHVPRAVYLFCKILEHIDRVFLFSMYGSMSVWLQICFVRYKNTYTVFVCFLGMGACPLGCVFVLQDIRTHIPCSFVFYVWEHFHRAAYLFCKI